MIFNTLPSKGMTTTSNQSHLNYDHVSTIHKNVAILGCGALGKSLLNSWINTNTPILSPKQVYISTSNRKSLEKLKNEYCNLLSENLFDSNESLVKAADIIIICVKPYVALDVFNQIRGLFKGKIIVSCCAGISWSDIHNSLFDSNCSTNDDHEPHIIRAVPNIACKFQNGVTSLYSHKESTIDNIKDMITFLFSSAGKVFWMGNESILNIGIALGSSSLAWISVIIEALVDGAVAMGMPRSMATEMICQSMIGTADFLTRNYSDNLESMHPAKLKDLVATPGGCTMAGLASLEHGSVRGDLIKTVVDCVKFLNEKDASKK